MHSKHKITIMNNFKNNNRRGRFKPNGDRSFRRNGNGNKPNGDFGNGSAFKRRHPGKNNQNAAKLVEKYNDLAREALSNGDKILSENYLQHSEHFSRILISELTLIAIGASSSIWISEEPKSIANPTIFLAIDIFIQGN